MFRPSSGHRVLDMTEMLSTETLDEQIGKEPFTIQVTGGSLLYFRPKLQGRLIRYVLRRYYMWKFGISF